MPTLTWAGTETYDTCFAQHEFGYGMTSYIPTTSAAATRAADLCTLSVGSWLNETEGTVWVDAMPADSDPAAATSPRVVNLSGGTSYHEIRRNAADAVAQAGTTTSGTWRSPDWREVRGQLASRHGPPMRGRTTIWPSVLQVGRWRRILFARRDACGPHDVAVGGEQRHDRIPVWLGAGCALLDPAAG